MSARALIAVPAALAVAGCGGARAPAGPVPTMDGGRCPVTRAAGAGAPRALQRLEGVAARASFGRGTLWVLLPSARANAVRMSSGFSVKVGWYLAGGGGLDIHGERLDGPGSLKFSGGYRVPGSQPRMQPSSFVISGLGCYAVTGRHGDASITWVFQAREAHGVRG
jgi:hypothetical protein